MRLDAASAGRLAALALACVGREFPNQPGHVMQRAGELDRPRSLHPAFFGCFDWHSAVHGHWLLARSEEHTSELQSRLHLVCRLLLEKKKKKKKQTNKIATNTFKSKK